MSSPTTTKGYVIRSQLMASTVYLKRESTQRESTQREMIPAEWTPDINEAHLYGGDEREERMEQLVLHLTRVANPHEVLDLYPVEREVLTLGQ